MQRDRHMYDCNCADDGSGMPLPVRPTKISILKVKVDLISKEKF